MEGTKPKFSNIDEYIALYPLNVQERLKQLRKLAKEMIPDATEALSYQIPTFKLNGKNVIHFAAFKNHIGVYPFPSGIEEFEKAAEGLITSKGTVQIPHDKLIPLDLVREIIKFRIQENIKRNSK